MRAEKPTIHHWNYDPAELLPVGVEEQPSLSFLTTQHTRCCHAHDFDRIPAPGNLLNEKGQSYLIYPGWQSFEKPNVKR